MQRIINIAKRVIAKLNDIQPTVSISGLRKETECIKEMKTDLHVLIGTITPDHATLGRALMACRTDAASHAEALRESLNWHTDLSDLTDDQVLTAIFAAESFIDRARAYLGSKANIYPYQGGNNHVAA